MSNDRELELIISANSRKLLDELKRSETGIDRFGKKTNRVFSGLQRGSLKIAKSLTSPMAGLIGGAALLAASKNIIDFDSDLTRLAIQSKITAKEQMKLRQEILDTAFAAGQSRSGVLSGVNKIVEQTGDLEFAREIMLDLAKASTATGAGMEYMGALAVQLKLKLGLAKGEIGAALNLLTVQGKAGAYTLENMATMGERLFSSAGRFNMRGLDDLRKFGSFVQIARMGAGSSEQATTAIEGVIADILDKTKQIKQIAGFDIFSDPKTEELKSFDQIVKGIIAGTKGSEIKLGKIFGRESIRALTTIASLYRKTGDFDLFDKLSVADASEQNALMEDFARYSQSAKFQLQMLSNVAWEFADSGLSPILSNITTSLRKMSEDPAAMEAFREQIKQIGSDVGTAASDIMDMVKALNAFLPLIKFIGGGVSTVAETLKLPGEFFSHYKEDMAEADEIINKWNKIPQEERKKRIQRLSELGVTNLKDQPGKETLSFNEKIDAVLAGKMTPEESRKETFNIKMDIHADGTVDASVDSGNVELDINVPRGKLVLAKE